MVMWKSLIVCFSSRKFQIQFKFQCNYLIQSVLYNTLKISDLKDSFNLFFVCQEAKDLNIASFWFSLKYVWRLYSSVLTKNNMCPRKLDDWVGNLISLTNPVCLHFTSLVQFPRCLSFSSIFASRNQMELVIDYLESSEDILQLGAQPWTVENPEGGPVDTLRRAILLCCCNIKSYNIDRYWIFFLRKSTCLKYFLYKTRQRQWPLVNVGPFINIENTLLLVTVINSQVLILKQGWCEPSLQIT